MNTWELKSRENESKERVGEEEDGNQTEELERLSEKDITAIYDPLNFIDEE